MPLDTTAREGWLARNGAGGSKGQAISALLDVSHWRRSQSLVTGLRNGETKYHVAIRRCRIHGRWRLIKTAPEAKNAINAYRYSHSRDGIQRVCLDKIFTLADNNVFIPYALHVRNPPARDVALFLAANV